MLFGKGAELLIDHAWGWEPCEISDIKSYKPSSNSLSSGQVLSTPYSFEKARLVAKEMLDMLVLDLVEKKLVTEQITVTVGYDAENLTDPLRSVLYKGEVTYDHYGRPVPKHGHGGVTFSPPTSSTEKILKEVMQLYDRVIDRNLLVRRITVCANNVVPENIVQTAVKTTQLDLFTDITKAEAREEREKKKRQKEKNLQKALIDIKKKYGKNGILKGMNYTEGATAKDRNNQIGGHKK
jgi:DNA polymerase V